MPQTSPKKYFSRKHFLGPLLFLVIGAILGFLVDSDLSRDIGILFIGIGALWAIILFIIIPINFLSVLPEKTTYTQKQMRVLYVMNLFMFALAFGWGMNTENSSSVIANWMMGIGAVGYFCLIFFFKKSFKKKTTF